MISDESYSRPRIGQKHLVALGLHPSMYGTMSASTWRMLHSAPPALAPGLQAAAKYPECAIRALGMSVEKFPDVTEGRLADVRYLFRLHVRVRSGCAPTQ